MKPETIKRMFITLKNISKYQNLKYLRKNSESEYGLSYEEVLEMAYENIIEEAKSALKGIRLPKKS